MHMTPLLPFHIRMLPWASSPQLPYDKEVDSATPRQYAQPVLPLSNVQQQVSETAQLIAWSLQIP